MKRFLLLFLILPAVVTAQVKKKPIAKAKITKPAAKRKIVGLDTPPQLDNVEAGGYKITGTIEGLADGTSLKMLNGSTGQEEKSTTVKAGKFSFSGKAPNPDFKLIGIDGQAPFITIFLDNSQVTVSAKAGALEAATVKGSTTHNDFVAFSTATAKYQDLFAGKGNYDVAFLEEAGNVVEKFVNANPNSFISPLAIYRHNQITGDFKKQEAMYNSLTAPIKASPIGNFISQQVAQNIAAGYGKPIAGFSQADTSGKQISLESFKGKYVLIDFWASWCGPCRAENPNVVRTYEKYKNKNFTVLGISLDKDKQKWIDAVAADGLNWTQLSDLNSWQNAVAVQFGIQSIPASYLLDPQGNLIGKNLRGSALEYKLMQVIK
jgi:thiol-disulfide isomerase/thioredoxin